MATRTPEQTKQLETLKQNIGTALDQYKAGSIEYKDFKQAVNALAAYLDNE